MKPSDISGALVGFPDLLHLVDGLVVGPEDRRRSRCFFYTKSVFAPFAFRHFSWEHLLCLAIASQ